MGRSWQVESCALDETFAAFTDVRLRSEADTRWRTGAASDFMSADKRRIGRYVAGAAAVCAVAAATIVFLQGEWRRSAASPVAVLAAAAPPYRNVQGRIAGFPYRPQPAAWRNSDSAADSSPNWRALGVGAGIRAAAGANPSGEQLHAIGIASLIAGDWEKAAVTLESDLESETGEPETTQAVEKSANGSLVNDLSVAYLAIARERHDPERFVAALECAERAWNRWRLPEAAWNRAVAFESMHLTDLARSAWREYLDIDSGSGWSSEASRHLADLTRSVAPPAAVPGCASVDAEVQEAFARWARAVVRNDAAASALASLAIRNAGETALRCYGDRSTIDSLRVIAGLPPEARDSLALAHLDFDAASKLFGADDYHGAEQRIRNAAEVFASAGDPYRWRATLLAASCAYQENEFAKAEALASLLIDHAAGEVPSRRFLARAFWIRGSSRASQGLVYEAIHDYTAAASHYAALNDREGTVGVETMLASQFETAGDSTESWKHRMAALELASGRAPNVRTVQLLLQMAKLAIREGEVSAARSFLDEQMVISRNEPQWLDLRVRGLLMRADAEQMANDEGAARRDRLEAFELAKEIRPEDVRFFTTTSADFVRARAAEGIAEDVSSAVAYARAHDHRIRLAELLMLDATTDQKEHASATARTVAEEALREIERQRAGIHTIPARDAFLESRSGIYASAIALALDQHDFEWAFRLSESSRSVMTAPAEGNGIVSMDAAQHALPADTAIVKFHVLPDRLLTWLIRREGTSLNVQPIASSQLGSAIRRFVARLRRADDLQSDDHMNALLVAPWFQQISGIRTIILVADADLTNVPFCALYGAGRPLLESFHISYAPTVTAFIAGMRAPPRLPATALIAAPDPPPGSNLDTLPEAGREASRIASWYRGARLLVGKEATRSRFLDALQHATVLHFAGHAIANEGEHALTALLLSGDDGSPSYLYAHDIAALSLRQMSLVVLTACSTASGRHGRRSSGLASLANAFAAAGAHTVIGTLWPITDAAGARLSVDFHDRIRRGVAPAAALQEIQLASLHRLPPREWAAFIAVGGADGL